MNIREVISNIKQSIFKPDLLDLIHNAKKELEEVNIPIFDDAINQFPDSYQYSSKEIKRLIPTFNVLVKKRQGGIVRTTHAAHQNMVKMLEKISPLIEKNFSEVNPPMSFTYKKAQYLQFLDAVKFYQQYARDFINYIIICETAQHDPGNQIQKRLTPVQIKRVETGFNNFCQLTNVFNGKVEEVMRLLERVPDIIVIPENIETVEATMGVDKVDPLKLNFINATSSPFYTLQIAKALWNYRRYEKAIEEREMLRLKLLNLRQIANNTPDPSIEKQIEVAEQRIQKLDYRIAKDEEEYA